MHDLGRELAAVFAPLEADPVVIDNKFPEAEVAPKKEKKPLVKRGMDNGEEVIYGVERA